MTQNQGLSPLKQVCGGIFSVGYWGATVFTELFNLR